MAKRKNLGNDDSNYQALASEFYRSAQSNFERIRERHSRADSCGLIEHYTDVVAEATVAEAVANEVGNTTLATLARKLTSTATRAQRGATRACQLGVKGR